MVILAFAWFVWRTPRKTRLRRCWLERMRALKMNTREYPQTESGNVQTRRDSDSENLESDWARHCKFPESNWGALDSLRLLKEKNDSPRTRPRHFSEHNLARLPTYLPAWISDGYCTNKCEARTNSQNDVQCWNKTTSTSFWHRKALGSIDQSKVTHRMRKKHP